MKTALVITFLTILRLGIPTTVLLFIGEGVRKHYEKNQTVSGD
jgi:hypothetical protein